MHSKQRIVNSSFNFATPNANVDASVAIARWLNQRVPRLHVSKAFIGASLKNANSRCIPGSWPVWSSSPRITSDSISRTKGNVMSTCSTCNYGPRRSCVRGGINKGTGSKGSVWESSCYEYSLRNIVSCESWQMDNRKRRKKNRWYHPDVRGSPTAASEWSKGIP